MGHPGIYRQGATSAKVSDLGIESLCGTQKLFSFVLLALRRASICLKQLH